MSGNGKSEDLLERIAARLDTLVESQQELHVKVERLETRVEEGFAQVDARFAQVDARFAQVDARFDQVDARFDKVDARIDHLVEMTGRYHADHERLQVLETAVLKKSG